MAEPGQKQYEKPMATTREASAEDLEYARNRIEVDPEVLQKIRSLRAYKSRTWERGRGHDNNLTKESFAKSVTQHDVGFKLEDELIAAGTTKKDILERIVKNRERIKAIVSRVSDLGEIPENPEDIDDELTQAIFYNLADAMPFNARTTRGAVGLNEDIHSLGLVDGQLQFDPEGHLIVGGLERVRNRTQGSEPVVQIQKHSRYVFREKGEQEPKDLRPYTRTNERPEGWKKAVDMLCQMLKDKNVVDLGAGWEQNFLWTAAVAGAKSYTAIDLPDEHNKDSYGSVDDLSKGRDYYNLCFELLGIRSRIPIWKSIHMDNLEAIYTKLPDESSSFVSFGTGAEFDTKPGYENLLREIIAKKTKIGGIVATLDASFGSMDGIVGFEKVYEHGGVPLKIYRKVK